MNRLSTRKALNPAYRKHKPLRKEVNNFIDELQACIKAVRQSDDSGEHEEHIKAHFKDFFKNTFYNDNYINTKGRIDLAIYLEGTASSDVGVIIEAKKPSNKAEFLTTENLNRKALQELLLYYLRERVDNENNNIKHLIATNGYEWFLFKAEDFYNYFYKNKVLLKEYKSFRDGLKDTTKNELFYDEIAKKHIAEVQENLPFVHLDFSKTKFESLKDAHLNTLYKMFSNVHLLGHSFGNDSNQLNKTFYNELLHVIGLEEVKEKGKKIISRKSEKGRDYASLLENTIVILEDRDYLANVKSVENSSDKAFNVGLELCLTWVNRILFLKLLESQLLAYHKQDKKYKFLNSSFVNGFDELNDLFFSALAKLKEERHPKYKDKYKDIPYLNSSLFERNTLENEAFEISALNNDAIEVFSNTVLKDAKGKRLKGKLSTLDYLFQFLDAYDFATDGNEGIEDSQETKSLINASVLGLIFEKINGYKEGSFYTPAYITMYMCKETLRRAVVQKFIEQENDQIETFEDLQSYCSKYFKIDDLKRFNHIINSLRICDPAVGSGHFLVSALNELIVIKKDLGVLVDAKGLPLRCDIEVVNDELYVIDNKGLLFEYSPTDKESTRIQHTLFHEKQALIENCLFGVDINPNSVKICRLRLWIELLKNAYYTKENRLQTLPNIDINIKCGNSLISRFNLDDDLKDAFRNKKNPKLKYTFTDYKNAVAEYKETNSKARKREVLEIIDEVKNNFQSTLDNKFIKDLEKAKQEVYLKEEQLRNLKQFGEVITKADKGKLIELKNHAEDIYLKQEEIVNNAIYHNAFEWRFEFPEVLSDDGSYVGFDAVIGNPPYIRLQGISSFAEYYNSNYKTATRKYDIYVLFIEKSFELLREAGVNSFILPHKFLVSSFGIGVREFLLKNKALDRLVHFGSEIVFEDASTYTCIFSISKNNSDNLEYIEIKPNDLLSNIEYNNIDTSLLSGDNWNLKDSNVLDLLNKIDTGKYLNDVSEGIYQGLISMGDDIFVLKGEIDGDIFKGYSQRLKSEVKIESEIMKPLLKGKNIQRYTPLSSDMYIIFPHFMNDIGKTEPFLEDYFKNNYPLAFGYLKQFKDELIKKKLKYKTNSTYWYSLHRSREIKLFESDYLITPQLQNVPSFTINEDKFYSDAGGYMISGLKNIKAKLLLGILNSKIMWFFIKNTSSEYSGGYFYFKTAYLKPFPLPKYISQEAEMSITKSVNNILAKKEENLKADTTALEKKIDQMVYKLYKLTPEEITIVENS